MIISLVALRKMFDQYEISLKNSEDKIEHFSSTYCVSSELVIESLDDLFYKSSEDRGQRSKCKRRKSNKEKRKNDKYSEYDWEELITNQI